MNLSTTCKELEHKTKWDILKNEEINILMVRDFLMMVLIVIFDEVAIYGEGKREIWFGYSYEGRIEVFPGGSKVSNGIHVE